MPTPRKSLIDLAVSGTLSKNLARYQSRIEAIPTVVHPIGPAPRHLDKTHKAIWAEVVRLAPHGILTKSDRIAVEVLVRLLLKVRCTDGKTSEFNAVMNILGKFGMEPTSRARLDLAREPSPDERIAQSAIEREWDELDELD